MNIVPQIKVVNVIISSGCEVLNQCNSVDLGLGRMSNLIYCAAYRNESLFSLAYFQNCRIFTLPYRLMCNAANVLCNIQLLSTLLFFSIFLSICIKILYQMSKVIQKLINHIFMNILNQILRAESNIPRSINAAKTTMHSKITRSL